MADSGPFKIVGWMSDDFSSWLLADIATLSDLCPLFDEFRPLNPQEQTLA